MVVLGFADAVGVFGKGSMVLIYVCVPWAMLI